MKSLIFAAALMLGGAAVAQDTTGTTGSGTGTGTTTPTDAGAQGTTTDSDTSTTTSTTTTTGSGMSGTGTGMSTTGTRSGMGAGRMAAGSVQAPGNAAPERDARGIPVISAEAAAPPGYNQPASNAAQPTPTVSSMGSAGQLPPCSRTVTDRCTQTYERGARAPR